MEPADSLPRDYFKQSFAVTFHFRPCSLQRYIAYYVYAFSRWKLMPSISPVFSRGIFREQPQDIYPWLFAHQAYIKDAVVYLPLERGEYRSHSSARSQLPRAASHPQSMSRRYLSSSCSSDICPGLAVFPGSTKDRRAQRLLS